MTQHSLTIVECFWRAKSLGPFTLSRVVVVAQLGTRTCIAKFTSHWSSCLDVTQKLVYKSETHLYPMINRISIILFHRQINKKTTFHKNRLWNYWKTRRKINTAVYWGIVGPWCLSYLNRDSKLSFLGLLRSLKTNQMKTNLWSFKTHSSSRRIADSMVINFKSLIPLDEILAYQKERESMKASHYYKATSLESELKHQVTKTANLKAKISKIRSVLTALNDMVKIGS